MHLQLNQVVPAVFASKAELARALGYTRSAISQWDNLLTRQQILLVVGAAVIHGRPIPFDLIQNTEASV